jgi:hypothetical protein
MELMQMGMFAAVVECGSMRGAAEREVQQSLLLENLALRQQLVMLKRRHPIVFFIETTKTSFMDANNVKTSSQLSRTEAIDDPRLRTVS